MAQYSLLLVLFISILGWGRLVSAKLLTATEGIPASGKVALQATAGLGLITILCIVVASFGALTAIPLLAIVVTGIALYVPRFITILGKLNSSRNSIRVGSSGLAPSILAVLAVLAVVSQALVRPLTIPLSWDEVAYHLPTAQAWATTGQLLITDWLRYPLFPFNMELLYAGALILGNVITAHLVHALTGFLAIMLTLAVARLFVPVVFAVLAAMLVFYTIKEPLLTADIDLGLMLYLFSAFSTLAFCFLEKRRSLVLLAAFFVGLALGTKYQAMFFLPALAVGFLLIERDWKMLGLATLVVIATGSYWYIRNFLVSGDPVHPVGGPVFGYWLWNADDIRRQFLDLESARNLPPWYLWPSAGSLIFWRVSKPLLRGCMAVTGIAVLVWFIVSGYDRYLMPIYPMLAILSSYFLHRLFTLIHGYETAAKNWAKLGSKAQMLITVVGLLAIIYDWGKSTYKDINELVLPNSIEQTTLLKETYPGFELLSALDKPLFGTLYQLNFEDEIFYLGTPVLGDHFGKDRYADVMQYVGRSAELSNHLRSLGAVYLMVNLVRNPTFIASASADPSFFNYFAQLGVTPGAVLYRIKEAQNSSRPREMQFTGNKF
jgi:hypothetical protein